MTDRDVRSLVVIDDKDSKVPEREIVRNVCIYNNVSINSVKNVCILSSPLIISKSNSSPEGN